MAQKSLFFSKEFHKFKELLSRSQRILISTHVQPDGDGLGAETALYHYLKRIKKSVQVYNPDPLPGRYLFLDPQKKILKGPGKGLLKETYDLWIIIDTNDPRRVGSLWSELALRCKHIVFLDHHPDITPSKELNYPPHARVVSDTESSSIGELLYRAFFHDLKNSMYTNAMAVGLYVSIMTDTNSFRYARTTPLAHEIAAKMIQIGVNPEKIYQAIYSSKEVGHLKLLGHMLQSVKTLAQGKIAWFEMPLEIRRQHGASADDTQSFLNLLLILKDSEIVCFFREEDNHHIRVSIRSKGNIKVNGVAMELGGGGHDYAAGLLAQTSLEKTSQGVIKRFETLLKKWEKSQKNST